MKGLHSIWLSVVAELSNRRQGTCATKTRSEVSGSGAKPYRQKGTGNARRGCKRTPLTRGGGVVFGPNGRRYVKSLNKKLRTSVRGSLLEMLSEKIVKRDWDSLNLDKVSQLKLDDSNRVFFTSNVLILLNGEFSVPRAFRGLRNVRFENKSVVKTVSLLNSDVIVEVI